MIESDIPIDIHTLKLRDWLNSRRIVPKNINPFLKGIHSKISNALQDMPSNDRLIKLLSKTNINYYHCKEIVDILKDTEKDTKSVFGTYGSQRMKDWQEIVKLYEKDNIYLAEAAQIYVRNINYEIPAIKRQMTKLEQQSQECLKRVQDLDRPEAQLLNERSLLLQQLDIKGENLQTEFTAVLSKLPDIYNASIKGIACLQEGIELYSEFSKNKSYLPILQHLIERGNTTVYEYLNKEAPLEIEENPVKIYISTENSPSTPTGDSDSSEGDNNAGTSSTISAEIIDYGELTLDSPSANINDSNEESAASIVAGVGDIDWGIESVPENTVEINFDIPLEEYGIVVEGVGMDGGIAKGEQAYTILDCPNYRDRLLDELYELEAFLKMRIYEFNQMNSSSSIMFSLMDTFSTHDYESIRKILTNVEDFIQRICNEHTRHLFQLKHSPKYADLLANKLKQISKAVEKIRNNKATLKQRASELKDQRINLNPVLDELIEQTKKLQTQIENDISKRYKNRVVNLIGGI